jgi:hypothetical protein
MMTLGYGGLICQYFGEVAVFNLRGKMAGNILQQFIILGVEVIGKSISWFTHVPHF